ncbi:MAG: branched-chain amino acid ABC transporter permease [Candidatus Bathyarchaeota archaeon]|nr:MAG: branched-chain amino acid ABC transporter permease [Candidatus Bathyarchaeota archaeon]
MLNDLIEIFLLGGLQSGMYSLLALGFTLIYGISGVVNLAHGSFYMLGAYMFVTLGAIGFLGAGTMLNAVFVLVLAAIVVGIIASMIYRVTIHPVLGDEVAIMVATVCIALIMQQFVIIFYGVTFPRVAWPEDSILMNTANILGVTIEYSYIAAFVVSLALFGTLMLIITKTKMGKAMRAVSQDVEAAMLMGINTERLYMLTMGLSAMLATFAGILITSSTTKSAGAWMWLQPLALSFAIVILGGLGSIKGSLIGGFILGYAEQTVKTTVPEGGAIVGVVPLIVMVLVLLLRPKGLFGKRVELEE